MLKKIVLLYVTVIVCFITLQGCTSPVRAIESSRVERLEFELYSITSRLERLESKLDMISWSGSPLISDKARIEAQARQLEELVVDLKTQVSHLNEQPSANNK